MIRMIGVMAICLCMGCSCDREFFPSYISWSHYRKDRYLIHTPHFPFNVEQPPFAERDEVYLSTWLIETEPPGKVTLGRIQVIDLATNDTLVQVPRKSGHVFKRRDPGKRLGTLDLHMDYTYTTLDAVDTIHQHFVLPARGSSCQLTNH